MDLILKSKNIGCQRTIGCIKIHLHHDDGKKSETLNCSLIKDKVHFIQGDVRNKNDWMRALNGVDVVIHLAAETGTGQSMYEIERYVEVNIGGTSNLLSILSRENKGIKKLIVASSRAIYGEGKYECPKHGIVYPEAREEIDLRHGRFEVTCPNCNETLILKATDEHSKIHPTSIYGITKQVQEQLVMNFAKTREIPCLAFRYQNVFGPGQSLKNPYTGILSIFSTIIQNGNTIQIFEDGRESRDFVYIDDVVNATMLGVESDKGDYDVFNVGAGINISVKEVADIPGRPHKAV